MFQTLPWPGNVRQLLNIMRQVVVMNDGAVVTRAMLPDELRADGAAPAQPETPSAVRQVQLDGLVGKTLAEVERLVIERTIAAHGGSVSKAALILGVAPSTLYRKIESWATAAR